jgi:NADP-dependent 3-hydroxy acid dehydrogenase YdfG
MIKNGWFFGTKYAIREMLKTGWGSIVNTASILGHVGEAGAFAYNASKGGVELVEKFFKRYCEGCKKETLQVVGEDALEIRYHCTECDKEQSIVKTFF